MTLTHNSEHATDHAPGRTRAALVHVAGWVAVALLATAVACTTWAWATEDPAAGLAGTASLALSVAVACSLERGCGAGHQPLTKEPND